MALSPRLDLRQSQSLVITPQLQQAIKLLQLSAPELIAYVEGELESNPLLEQETGGDAGVLTEAAGNADDRDDALTVVEKVDQQDEAPLDMDHSDDDEPAVTAVTEGPTDSGNWESPRSGVEAPDLERTVAEAADLRSHLTQQLNLATLDDAGRLIGSTLIDNLDDSGYLTAPLNDVAEHLGANLADVERVLTVLQDFDPAGVFARDLKECLKLQLQDRDRFDPAMEAFITNIELLASRNLKKLQELCAVSMEDIQDMITEVRALNPKPGLVFERSVDEAVVPDILMIARPDGGWRVELNPDTLPRVLVNHSYHAEITKGANKTEKAFITERFQSANWLVKALHQRAETIMKVATELVKQQDGFFRHGITHLKPLILRDVADAIEMHESTVSRVTTNKYMSSPRGIFELKYFFTQALPSSSGEAAHSAEAVRHRIKTMIENEGADDVLSDDKIVDILRADGVEVARRTVAKYRDSLNIPSSVQRRRDKAAGFPVR